VGNIYSGVNNNRACMQRQILTAQSKKERNEEDTEDKGGMEKVASVDCIYIF
jgi:hypothetical protein